MPYSRKVRARNNYTVGRMVFLAVIVCLMVAAYQSGMDRRFAQIEKDCDTKSEFIITYERHYICYRAHVDGEGA